MKYLALCFVLCFLGIDASRKSKCGPKCPPLKPEGDYNDPKFLANATSTIINGLWADDSLELSENGKCLRSEILRLLNGTDQQKAMANTASFWIWAVIPQLNEGPAFGLCPFAEIVDGTVGFLKNKDCCGLSTALRNVAGSVVDGSLLTAKTAVTKSGCGKAKITGTQPTCPGNGVEYQLDELLELVECDYPKSFRKVLKKLYNSCDQNDKILASLTAASLSAPFQEMITVFDSNIKLQLFAQAQTKKLPKECCRPFIKELKAILKKMEDEADESAQEILEKYGCH